VQPFCVQDVHPAREENLPVSGLKMQHRHADRKPDAEKRMGPPPGERDGAV